MVPNRYAVVLGDFTSQRKCLAIAGAGVAFGASVAAAVSRDVNVASMRGFALGTGSAALAIGSPINETASKAVKATATLKVTVKNVRRNLICMECSGSNV